MLAWIQRCFHLTNLIRVCQISLINASPFKTTDISDYHYLHMGGKIEIELVHY